MKHIITPADITIACNFIADHGTTIRQRPLPTTPARRAQAILAAGREALANVLMWQRNIPNWTALTKAIRAGHQGDATDFAAINKQGAQALGIWES